VTISVELHLALEREIVLGEAAIRVEDWDEAIEILAQVTEKFSSISLNPEIQGMELGRLRATQCHRLLILFRIPNDFIDESLLSVCWFCLIGCVENSKIVLW
jgi:hypothetical protein